MKRMLSRLALFAMSFAVGMLPFFPNAIASAATHTKALVSQQNTTIDKGQVVEDVLVLGHNVTIHGVVSELLVVIDGNVHLQSTARAHIVVDLGGRVKQDSGAKVNALYQIPLHTPFWNGTLFGAVFALFLWGAVLALGITLVILAVLLSLGLKDFLMTPVSHIEKSASRSGVLGLLVTLASGAVAALCAVTIIGLPLTLLIGVIYIVVGLVGFAVVSVWFGKLATRYAVASPPLWMLSLIGASLLVALMSIPFLGVLLFCIAWCIGLGGVASRFAQFTRRRKAPTSSD